MKGPLSSRSKWLRGASWAFFGLGFVVPNLLSVFVRVPRIRIRVDQHDPVFWLSLVPVAVWIGVLVAYCVSRLNDA